MSTVIAGSQERISVEQGELAAAPEHAENFQLLTTSYRQDFVRKLEKALETVPEEERREFADLLKKLSQTIDFLEKISPHDGDEHRITRIRMQSSYYHLLDRMDAVCPNAKQLVQEELDKSTVGFLLWDIPIQRWISWLLSQKRSQKKMI